MKKKALVLVILLSIKTANAITFEDAVFPELATSARALAMGNAFIAKADDASAVFYNPAGLGTVRYPHLHLSNFGIETNKGLLSAATDGSIGDAFSGVANMFSLDGMRQLLASNTGKIAHSRLHALPNFTSRYFSMGFLIAKRTRAVVNDTSATGFEYADRTDLGPYLGLNFSLFGGVVKIGASGIILTRKEVNQSGDPAVALNLTDSSYDKGTAAIVTTGAKITLPVAMLPTFAATYHNALNKNFSSASGSAGAPDKMAQSLDVGFSLTPQIGTNTRFHFEVNYKDISSEVSGVSSTRKLLVGGEFDFYRVFFFRVGYGDGFGSAGLGVKSRKLEFDFTTYAVDTTSSAYRGEEDRRFAIGLSSGF